MRWRHPEYGLVSPGQFIPMAEEVGELDAFGNWSLSQALQQVVRWDAEGHHLSVSVNVTGNQWEGQILENVRRALSETGVSGERLSLELSGVRFERTDSKLIQSLASLRDEGVQIAIDGFGGNSSAFVALKSLPIDEVKIDRLFMKGIPKVESDRVICQSIIDLAHSMNVRVVAEGVENRAQLAWAQERACHAIQGYFFSAALGAEQVSQVVQEGRRIQGGIVVFDS